MATWLSAELSLVYSRLSVSELVGSFQRSSYSCRFFVLPCCFFDFVGRHCRRQSGKTQYRGYLDFISEVGSACGFRVEEDCLRIPSTRRVRPAPARPAGGAGAWGGGGGGLCRSHERPWRLRARVFQTAPVPVSASALGVQRASLCTARHPPPSPVASLSGRLCGNLHQGLTCFPETPCPRALPGGDVSLRFLNPAFSEADCT